MSRARATTALIASLHPGVSLAHGRADEIRPVDALMAMGRCEHQGSIVLHAKLVGEGLDQLAEVVKQTAMEQFVANRWDVNPRRHHSREDTIVMFTRQVMREFLGEPCAKCKGHGVLGNKLDTVRHSLDTCGPCKGAGYTVREHMSTKLNKIVKLRVPCSTCRGKRYVAISEAVKAERLKACVTCDGTGVVQDSYRARARAMHYDHMHIHRVWGERFRAVLRNLRTIERRAIYECANFLFDDS